MPDLPLILASASPRRRELLSLILSDFEVIPSLADEITQGEGASLVVLNALLKGREVAARFPGRCVLSSDTLVCVDGQSLGKPKDEKDAYRMLALLSGRWHEVHTAICLISPDGKEDSELSTTRVHFMPLTHDDIRRYVQSGEPMDKAGAYALQGVGGMYIDRVQGSPSGVIGLALDKTRILLERAKLL